MIREEAVQRAQGKTMWSRARDLMWDLGRRQSEIKWREDGGNPECIRKIGNLEGRERR